MTTAKEVINDALEDVYAKVAGEPIDAEDGAMALRTLNDMMAMWSLKGVNIGFTLLSNMGGVLTVPAGSIYGIKKILAISLAPKFLKPVPPDVSRDARSAWEAILEVAFGLGQMSYPSTLPIGSGNSRSAGRTFYPELDEAVYTETSGYIALEDNS